MSLRPIIVLASALSMTVGSWSAAASEAPVPHEPTPVDSVKEAAPSVTQSARAAYQNAWAERQAGDYATAVELSEATLKQVGEALAQNPDMTTRRDLTELQSKLSGLRDAARHDLEAASQPQKPQKSESHEAPKASSAPSSSETIEAQTNADVTRWIEFFTGAGRSTFERWLRRSGRYAELFRSVLQKEGLPPDLVHLVYVESGFNIKARSSSQAVGPWQFLRSTARLFGLAVNQWIDERRDPEKSTVAAARYLKHLYSIFGDWPLALASYNAGEGTVLRAIQRQGTTNYWDLRLPSQTEDYVPQFMAVLTISRDPGKYGFKDVELEDPMTFDEVALKGPVDLRALAQLADCSVEDLRELNPAVLRHAANGSNGVTTLRVPRGKGEILMDRLQNGARLPAVAITLRHRVRRGETLAKIARHYHVGVRQLAEANDIGRNRPLRRGMVLEVPSRGRTVAPAPALLADGDPRASTAYVPDKTHRVVVPLEGKSAAEGRMTLTVRRGQTLASIAEDHGVSTADIVRWNHLKSTRVRRGMRLKIRTDEAKHQATAPSDSVAATTAAAAAFEPGRTTSKLALKRGAKSRSSHARAHVVRVRRGETLGTIARRHGVTVTALRRANRLNSNQVRAGTRLKLPNG